MDALQAQWRQAAVNVSTAELFLITLIYTRERCFLSFERPRLKPNGTEDKSASCGVSVVHWGFDVSSSYFPTLSMNTCSLGPLLFCLSSMTFLQVSHLPSCVPTSCRLVHLPSFSVAVSPGACACLAHTGDSSNSKHGRVKTNPFCPNENKPLSFLLALSLSHSLFLSTPFPLVLFLS